MLQFNIKHEIFHNQKFIYKDTHFQLYIKKNNLKNALGKVPWGRISCILTTRVHLPMNIYRYVFVVSSV